MRIAEHAGSDILRQMIERNHVLILNWLFDVAGRRTPFPPGSTPNWWKPWSPAIPPGQTPPCAPTSATAWPR
jgi:hypothetical protein